MTVISIGTSTLPALQGPWSSDRDEDTFVVENPATGEPLATVVGGGADQVDATVRRARVAFAEWRQRSPRERGRFLFAAAEKVREHADELAALETLEMGKPYEQSRLFDVEFCSASFDYYGGLADKSSGEFVELGPIQSIVVQEPYGVVAGILPFNWPPIHTAGKVSPAIAAGNAVVLKPPDQAPLTIMRIVELLQEVLPENLVQVMPGAGPGTGIALASHPGVDKLSFTGATATGRAVLKLAADNLTPALLELGGKNPLIVFDDADLEHALRSAVEGAFFNQGEACTAASRILVQDGLHDEFVDRLAAAIARLRVGNGMDPSTDVGPVVTHIQRERVQRYIDIGVEEGARVAVQAPLPDDPALAGGCFVAPTLFTDVTPNMTIAREEIFGPVTAVIRFETENDAIRIANDTDYGLIAGVFTSDAERGQRVSRAIDAGVVLINTYNRNFLGGPFGGTKGSGYGREHGIETLREFSCSKNLRMPSGRGQAPFWRAAEAVFQP